MFLLSKFASSGDIVHYVITNGHHHNFTGESHMLSYYITKTNWPSNTTLIFLPGQHEMTGNFIIEGLNSMTLKGEAYSGDDIPIIISTSHTVAVRFCGSVSIANLIFKSSFLYIEETNTTNITNILADFFTPFNLAYFKCLVSYRTTLICFKARSQHQGNLQMHNVVASHQHGNGIPVYIECHKNAIVNMNDVSVSNSSGHGMIIIGYPSSIASLAKVSVHYNALNGILIECYQNSELYLSNVAATNNFWANIKLLSLKNTSINMNRISLNNGHDIGLSLTLNHSHLILKDVTVRNNAKNGIYANCISSKFDMNNATITNNTQGVATEGSCSIRFLNSPSVISNNRSPSNGGGMWISESTIIIGDVKSITYFINNTADGAGGAIYVVSPTYTKSNGIQRCTFQNFAPVFENNSALVSGDNVYNGLYWGCYMKYNEVGELEPSLVPVPFANTLHQRVNCNHLYNFPKPYGNFITSSAFGVCISNDTSSTVNCKTRSIVHKMYPGQSISLSLATVGACGGIAPSVLVTSISSGVGVVNPDNNHETGRKCKNFTYTINQMNKSKEAGQLKIGLKKTATNMKILNDYFTINVSFSQCPIGLDLHAISGACDCGSIIGAINGTECDINMVPHPISRSGTNWLYYSKEYECVVAHTNCPFDYCNKSSVRLNLTESDLQCTNGRSGILCGECQQGLSLVLGSNKCQHCSNDYLLLVVAFILAGMLLVVFLLVSNMTVSVGSINGLLFYANVMKLNEAALFPNGISLPVLSQFIAWLNLDLGIQTCFFNGLDGYWKTWLQFAFPLYIWLLIIIIIILSHYSGKVTRLCGNNSVPVLATLVFMSYTKLLRLITNILMLAVVKCKQTHWFVSSIDGNIRYLSRKHIPIFLVGILFLVAGLIYTGLVLFVQWLQHYSGKCFKSSHDPIIKLKPFIDAYTGPYKDKYRYWTGFLLIMRLLLTTVFAYTTGTVPKINNYIIAVMAAVLLYLSKGIYRKRSFCLLEGFYLINLGLMAQLNVLLEVMNLHATSTSEIITAVSISLSLAAFVITIFFHFTTQIKKKYHLKFCISIGKSMERKEKRNPLLKEDDEMDDLYSPARVIMRREPLIFDFQTD